MVQNLSWRRLAVLLDHLVDAVVEGKVKVSIPNGFELIPVESQQQNTEHKGRVNDKTERDIVLDQSLNDDPNNAAQGKTDYACKSVHSFPTDVVVFVIIPKISQDGSGKYHIVDGNPRAFFVQVVDQIRDLHKKRGGKLRCIVIYCPRELEI